ncbi:MAG: hypothetical protein L6408_01030 [Nanoarchaeota archaeon]|nr:hypothetical protein [Nanoarchaeota archaeon]
MKAFNLFAVLVLITFLFSGCAAGPYKAIRYDTNQDLERQSNVVIIDKRLSNQFSTKRAVILGEKTEWTQDNRLKVFCEIRNMKKDLLRLQIQTVFKDEGNFSIEQDTNWELVLIPGFSTYTYSTTALSNEAKRYTIRIKYAQ